MRGKRGQTSLDFAAGMSTFLLVFAFTLTFVPGMLQPFTASGQEETVTADRVADQLAEGILVTDTSNPYVLSVTCTTAFFDDRSPAECRHSGSDLAERTGLSTYPDSTTYRQRVHVRMIGKDADSDGNPDTLCNDGSGNIDEKSDVVTCDTEFSIGDDSSNSRSVVVARRTVSIDGKDATLLVKVW